MIRVTRLNGTPFALNPDLFERVEANHDTVITLVDDTKYVVKESFDAVLDAVAYHRAEVLALAGQIEQGLTPQPGRDRLTVVPSPVEEN